MCVAIGYAILCVYGLHEALPYNPLVLPFEDRVHLRQWLPEGWNFFTRDPQEERAAVYERYANSGWAKVAGKTLSDASNMFGLSRRPRAQSVETGLLLVQVPDAFWRSRRGAADACLRDALLFGDEVNPTPRPLLCGELGIVLQRPVPWAWSSSERRVVMPCRVVRLNVVCLGVSSQVGRP